MKSVGNLNDLTSPPPSWNTLSDKVRLSIFFFYIYVLDIRFIVFFCSSCIEAKTKSEGLDDEKTSSSLASCMEEITKHVELLKQELEKPYTSAHCLKWADLLFSDTSYVFGGSND